MNTKALLENKLNNLEKSIRLVQLIFIHWYLDVVDIESFALRNGDGADLGQFDNASKFEF